MRKSTLLILLFFISLIGLSQNDSIPDLVTDRPDATESSSTLPPGSFQIETGFSFFNIDNEEFETQDFGLGNTLFRYGLFDNFELRLSSFYGNTKVHFKELNSDSTYAGLGALTAGFKVFIHEEEGWIPEFSIIADITLRHIGSEDFRPTYSFPTARLAASHTLTKNLSLGYNFGFAYDGEIADGFFVFSTALGYRITPGIGAFIEIFGDFDHANLPHNMLDGGFTFLVRHNLQLDASAGIALAAESDIYFVSAGLSWRIPG
jgi:hypothetical protein